MLKGGKNKGKLKESEREYKRVFEFSPEVIGIIDNKGNLLDVNRRLYDWIGYKPEEVIGKNFLKLPFLPDESKAIAMEKFSLSLTGEDVQPYELDFITKTGEKRVGRILTNAITNENGKLIGELVMASDITDHKKMEEELRESEEKYRTLVENLNVGVYRNTSGPQGKFIEANPAIINMFGYESREEFFKINVSDLYQNPKDREKFNEKILKNGYARNRELKLKKKDGKPFWGSVTAITVNDENGKVKYYDGIIDDITRRKQAEATLRKNEERLSNFMNSATDAFAVFNSELNLVEVNKVGLKMFPAGTKKEDVLGKNITELYPDIRETGRYDKYLEVIKSGKSFFIDDVVLHPTFGDVHVAVSAFRVGDGLGIIATDITEAKKMEEAIKESEERYRSVVENANDAIYIITLEGFGYVNPAFEELVGYTLKEICSKHFNFWNIIHPDDRKLIKEREEARKKGKKIPTRYEFRIIAKNGKTKIVEATTVNIGKKGEIKVMGILRDITEKRKAEEEMKRALEQEREFKLRTAHYFFNPIAIAKGYLDLMADEVEKEQKKKLKTIHHAVERVESVVRNVVTKGEIRE